MIPEKLKNLIVLLKDKTIARKTIWNKTSGNEQFKLSFPDGSSLLIERFEDYNNGPGINLVIFNSNGDPIERFNTYSDESSMEDLELLISFHKAVTDAYYKVEETMDALFTQISTQDIIGVSDEQVKAPEEDDLPF